MQDPEFGYMIFLSFNLDGKLVQFKLYEYIVYSLEKVQSRIDQIKTEIQQKWVVKDYTLIYKKVYLLQTNDITRQINPTIIIAEHSGFSSMIYKDLVYFDKIHIDQDYQELIDSFIQSHWSINSHNVTLDI